MNARCRCPLDGCVGTIQLHAAWRAWWGQCSTCRRFVLAADDRLISSYLPAVALPPAGHTWTRVVLAGGEG